MSWFSWTLLGLEHWSSAVKRSVQLSIGSFLSRQRLVEPLVLGGEVGEGGVQLLNRGHNILGGDSRARTKHLEEKRNTKWDVQGCTRDHLQVLLRLLDLFSIALHLALKLTDQPEGAVKNHVWVEL